MNDGEIERAQEIRAVYDAWSSGDLDAILAATSDDFVWHLENNLPDMQEEFVGPEGVKRLWSVWFSGPWAGNLEIEIRHIIEVDDDHVLVLMIFRGKGEGSGVPVSIPYAHVLTYRDGVNVRIDGFVGWTSALAKVGLDEIPDVTEAS